MRPERKKGVSKNGQKWGGKESIITFFGEFL